MKRFIRYLYEYEQEKRMRNVGFVNVEQGEDECRSEERRVGKECDR